MALDTADGQVAYLDTQSGEILAYSHWAGASPGVVFLPGFNSDMNGTKALALAAWCRQRERQFTRFDYSGHGLSSGDFSAGSIGQWCDDTLAVLDRVTDGPQVLVGSSMGGWLMLLVALARPGKIAGLLGIASAPDFTERLFSQRLGDKQRTALAETGYCELPNHYGDGKPHTIGRQLIEDGRNHLVLDGDIDIRVPVRLVHGQADADVPWQLSMDIAERLTSTDVEVQLVKGGDHRLSAPADLLRLKRCLQDLLATLEVSA
jgi:pimeloyl-ACP methyl ester carboxylesterase